MRGLKKKSSTNTLKNPSRSDNLTERVFLNGCFLHTEIYDKLHFVYSILNLAYYKVGKYVILYTRKLNIFVFFSNRMKGVN